MPEYIHKCVNESCDTGVFVDRRKMDDYDKVIPCPDCGEDTIKKQAATSFRLSGGGWFSDGYSGDGED